jgi:hypothetical protein
VIATLGRVDELAASGALASLLASGAKHCEQVMLLSTLRAEADSLRLRARRIGAPLLFGRLWEETGCQAVLGSLLAERMFEFPLERAVFATVLHRIMVSGSDRACEMDRRLRHPRRWQSSAPPPLPGHGLARGRVAEEPAEGCNAVRAGHDQGADRGGAVCPTA